MATFNFGNCTLFTLHISHKHNHIFNAFCKAMCVCVCVCVCERERERETDKGKEKVRMCPHFCI